MIRTRMPTEMREEKVRIRLTTPGVHEMLRDKKMRTEKYGITPEEYGGMNEFMHLTNYFAKEQFPFADGRIQLVQHYIYAPLMFTENDSQGMDTALEGVDIFLKDNR